MKTTTKGLLVKPLLVGILIYFVSCKKKTESARSEPSPIACFTMNKKYVARNEVIAFKMCSENFDRVEWDFGDGKSSTIAEPTHTWEDKGVFDVILTTYKGSASSKFVSKAYVSVSSEITFSANYQWKFSKPYVGFDVGARLYRSTDLYNVYEYYPYNSPFVHLYGDTLNNKNIQGVAKMLDDKSLFRVKVLVWAYYYENGGLKSDSTAFFTDEISAIEGARKSTETIAYKFGKFSYSFSPVSFK